MKLTRDQIADAYRELDRRFRHEAILCDTPEEVHDLLVSMLQGLYSVFIVLAENWPDVRTWTDEEEEKRGYFTDNTAERR